MASGPPRPAGRPSALLPASSRRRSWRSSMASNMGSGSRERNQMKATFVLLSVDGFGPEVVHEARAVLELVGERFGHHFAFTEHLIGGIAIDRTSEALPASTLAAAKSADAVLLGAVGGPKWDNPEAKVRPEQGLLGIRKALGLFANLRPVKLHPRLVAASPRRPERLEGVDMLVVRELTGGIYFGEKGRDRDADGQESAYDACTY